MGLIETWLNNITKHTEIELEDIALEAIKYETEWRKTKSITEVNAELWSHFNQVS